MSKFIREDELQEILEGSLSKLDEVLERVYLQARQDALRDIPDVISRTISRQIKLRELMQGFADSYPDLKKNTGAVVREVNNIQSQHPEWDMGRVVDEAAKRVREMKEEDRHAEILEQNRQYEQANSS